MARNSKLTLEQQIYEAKLAVVKAYEDYTTALYLDTMPTANPTYKYCYATSNMSIPAEFQCIDYWLRAIIKHMANRRMGHGGELTDALLVSISDFNNQIAKDAWIDSVTRELNKRSKIVKKAKQ
jgi:hypothetical protein